ncbi:hypothetical protein A5821_000371 [Enterococcus sp. 7F3_DIV0205]|uniref:Uncharacterized protein n=1 Tax=Candidatus Enterococcus palustris TaxID=1834189 RepID=A0AAQ3W5Q0_9ENTE|nr:hypothetical protein [Enterococcus sp. 7F3_DIV0205]OTN84784.1 hypothetical protein A5821_000713 [Enterococcus sp. 7F3_DIV0205]
MVNVIKMDLYRMFRSKSTYFVLVGLLSFMIMLILPMNNSIGEPDADVKLGISTNTEELKNIMDLKLLFTIMAGSNSFMMGIVIFSVLFINREEVSGFTKNIAGQVQIRGMLALSKFVSQSVFVLLSFSSGLLVFFTVGNIVFESVKIGNIFDLFKEVGLQFIFHVAFAAIVLGIITLFKQSVASMLVGILITFGGLSYIYKIINDIIHKLVTDKAFNIMNYTITGIIPSVSIDSSVSTIVRGIIVSVVFIVIMLTYSVIMKQKRDVD